MGETTQKMLTLVIIAVVFFGAGFGTGYYYIISQPVVETVTIRIISCSGGTIWKDAQGNTITRPQQIQTIAEDYLATHPNVEIIVDGVGWTAYRDKLMVTSSAGNPYDIMEFLSFWVDDFARNGWLYSLDDFLTQIDPSDFYQGPLLDGRDSVTGVQYHIPTSPDTDFIFYNKKIFADAGLEPPTSWENFLEIAPQLTQDTDDDGVTDIYASAFVGDPAVTSYLGYMKFFMLTLSFGGPDPNQYLYDFATNRYLFNGTEGYRALSFMKQCYDEGYIPDVLALGPEDPRLMFTAEIVAMVTAQPYWYPMVEDANPDFYENRLGVILPIPGTEGGERWGRTMSWGFVVSNPDIYVGSEAADREVVLDFLEYLLQAENMIKLIKMWPARQSGVPLLEAAGQWGGAPDEEIAVQGLDCRAKPKTPELGTDIDDVLYDMVVSVLAYDADIQAALDAAVAECNRLLEEAG